MKFLVDSNVLSETTKPHPDGRVSDWLLRNEQDLAINPIVLGKMEYGILLLPSGGKRRRLQEWFTVGSERLRVVDFDQPTGAHLASLLARLKTSGLSMPIKDSLIAASALAHDLTVATRNIADFRHAGVRLVNPFDASHTKQQ